MLQTGIIACGIAALYIFWKFDLFDPKAVRWCPASDSTTRAVYVVFHLLLIMAAVGLFFYN